MQATSTAGGHDFVGGIWILGKGDFARYDGWEFRSVRGATNGLPLDRKKLLKKGFCGVLYIIIY